jgi:hypothetical protein
VWRPWQLRSGIAANDAGTVRGSAKSDGPTEQGEQPALTHPGRE